MDIRHPECPDVHLGVCPKCRRLYARDTSSEPDEGISGRTGRDDQALAEEPSPQSTPSEDVPSAPKETRLNVARTVLTDAQRSKRYREKRGDAYRDWNRERMKEYRRAKKADP